jgi:acetoin utilization protein AcuB
MRDKDIRHVPVVSGAHLVGIVTDRDIRDASPSPATTLSKGEIAYQMDSTPVKTCMTENVVTVNPDMDIVQATRLLLAHKFGCLPVVQEGRLAGIVTEVDFLRAFLAASNA